MTHLFTEVLNMSISASLLILVVLIFRMLLNKAPKYINVLLWGLVAVRLVCPFSIESGMSLMPETELFFSESNSEVTNNYPLDLEATENMTEYNVGDALGENIVVDVPAIEQNQISVLAVLAVIWCVGAMTLGVHTVVSYMRLKGKIDTAVLLKGRIYQSENVDSPFVLGVLRPRIYMPFDMEGRGMEYVIAHEQAHIKRMDHWWKPLGFMVLIIHWFNPLVWVSYGLLCKDIEQACDEKVVKDLGRSQRADYSQTLLSFCTNKNMIACPLSFGEVGVKGRVKSVLKYRKPKIWVVAVSVVACVVVAMCFLTNPKESSKASATPSDVDMEDAVEGERISLEFSDVKILMTLPESWKGQYAVEKSGNSAVVYNPQIREANTEGQEYTFGGVLFTISCYEGSMTEQQYIDNGLNVTPYRYITATENCTYIVHYVTDVQYDSEDGTQVELYQKLYDDIENIRFEVE